MSKQVKITILLNAAMAPGFEHDVKIILSDPQAFGDYKSFNTDRVTVEEIDTDDSINPEPAAAPSPTLYPCFVFGIKAYNRRALGSFSGTSREDAAKNAFEAMQPHILDDDENAEALRNPENYQAWEPRKKPAGTEGRNDRP